jgi:mRNA interferase MazF
VRPVVVISNDWFNDLENYLHVVVPVTGSDRGFIFHYRIGGREGGLSKNSVVMCDQVRAISPLRFLQKRGNVSVATLAEIRRLVSRFLEDQPPYIRLP